MDMALEVTLAPASLVALRPEGGEDGAGTQRPFPERVLDDSVASDSEQPLGHGQKDLRGPGHSLCLTVVNIPQSQWPGERVDRGRLLSHSSRSSPSPSIRFLRSLPHKTREENVNGTGWSLLLPTPKWKRRASTRVRHPFIKGFMNMVSFRQRSEFHRTKREKPK